MGFERSHGDAGAAGAPCSILQPLSLAVPNELRLQELHKLVARRTQPDTPGPGAYNVYSTNMKLRPSHHRPHNPDTDGPFPLAPGQLSMRARGLGSPPPTASGSRGPAPHPAAAGSVPGSACGTPRWLQRLVAHKVAEAAAGRACDQQQRAGEEGRGSSGAASAGRCRGIKIGTGPRDAHAPGRLAFGLSLSRALAAGLHWAQPLTKEEALAQLAAHQAELAGAEAEQQGEAQEEEDDVEWGDTLHEAEAGGHSTAHAQHQQHHVTAGPHSSAAASAAAGVARYASAGPRCWAGGAAPGAHCGGAASSSSGGGGLQRPCSVPVMSSSGWRSNTSHPAAAAADVAARLPPASAATGGSAGVTRTHPYSAVTRGHHMSASAATATGLDPGCCSRPVSCAAADAWLPAQEQVARLRQQREEERRWAAASAAIAACEQQARRQRWQQLQGASPPPQPPTHIASFLQGSGRPKGS